MKTKDNDFPEAQAMQHPKSMRPPLLALALITAVLGATGCKPHD